MSSNTQITLAEFLTLLPAAQTLCSSPAKPCCPGCPAPLLPWNLLSPLPTAAQGILCLVFPPDWPWVAKLLQHPLLRLLPSHPSTFPCAQECPFLVLVHISLLPVYKASCKVKHQSALSSQPQKSATLLCSCLGNKASFIRRIAILK